MKKKEILSRIEYYSFILWALTGLSNKLWLSNKYIETLSWTFLIVCFMAKTKNREGKKPWELTINLLFCIASILIVLSDIISYLR